jgi:hypothetical protein
LLVLLFALAAAPSPTVMAQTPTATAVPTLIPVSGELRGPEGEPRQGTLLLVISLYEGRDDPAPRWIEHQTVTLDAAGGYSVQFGATREDGLPTDLFTGAASTRWLGVAVEGEPEQPRVMLVSVPYAAKAASADALSGKTVEEFVLTSTLQEDVRTVLEDEGIATTADIAGTLNFLQKGDGAAGTLDSSAFEAGGNVGIGTTTPRGRLDVNGNLFSSNIETGSVTATSVTSAGVIRWGNNIALSARNAANTAYVPLFKVNTLDDIEIGSGGGSGNDVGVFGDSQVTLAAAGLTQLTLNAAGASFAVNVGIGTGTPTAKLHVNGDLRVDGNIGARYQDVAEWVHSREPLEAGTVVSIDTAATNRVVAVARAYDSRVAGAVSAQPGIILGEKSEGQVLVAQSGRVRIKADARFGAIRPGDLLVSSPTLGHAMRADAGKVKPGTVIGKALEALPSGRGEILALLTLQ